LTIKQPLEVSVNKQNNRPNKFSDIEIQKYKQDNNNNTNSIITLDSSIEEIPLPSSVDNKI
jgi:hypothetical protein